MPSQRLPLGFVCVNQDMDPGIVCGILSSTSAPPGVPIWYQSKKLRKGLSSWVLAGACILQISQLLRIASRVLFLLSRPPDRAPRRKNLKKRMKPSSPYPPWFSIDLVLSFVSDSPHPNMAFNIEFKMNQSSSTGLATQVWKSAEKALSRWARAGVTGVWIGDGVVTVGGFGLEERMVFSPKNPTWTVSLQARKTRSVLLPPTPLHIILSVKTGPNWSDRPRRLRMPSLFWTAMDQDLEGRIMVARHIVSEACKRNPPRGWIASNRPPFGRIGLDDAPFNGREDKWLTDRHPYP
ncbi:hypothetical protein EDB86DRAFT_3243637 [Lactarius hatsudake]|nr:hypothetical protein EDB86DRAFT_3243637 [Lactarius hatsudake]